MLSWHGTHTRLAVFVLYMTLRGFSDVLEQVCCIHRFPRPPPCVHFSIIVMLFYVRFVFTGQIDQNAMMICLCG